MKEQLLLFETPQKCKTPPPRPPVYSPVLAVFPDEKTARQITDLGNSLRTMHRMWSQMRPINHLHVSLPLPDLDTNELEAEFEAIWLACNAAATVTRPFEITFDQVMSFRRRSGSYPLVLLNDKQRNEGIMSFYRSLGAEFAKYFSTTASISQFVPHLTLLYDKQELAPRPVEPVSWTVKEIVLVLSEVGKTKYHQLARWEFGG
jgi:2'-5' RNA ligase